MLIPILSGVGTGLLTLATTMVVHHYKYRETRAKHKENRDNRMERIAVGKADEIDARIDTFMDRQEAEIARLGLKVIELERRVVECESDRGAMRVRLSAAESEIARMKGAA